VNADVSGAIGADVVLVGTELTALSSDALQLLLGRRVGIADLQLLGLAFFAETNAVVLPDDILALIASLETG
jgi:hypothetical protein